MRPSKKVCGLCPVRPSIRLWCKECGDSATRCEPCGYIAWCFECADWVCDDCIISCPLCGNRICDSCFDARCEKCKCCNGCYELQFDNNTLTWKCPNCPRTPRRWTQEETEKLLNLSSEGASSEFMAHELSRTIKSVTGKLKRISTTKGKKRKSHPRGFFDWVPLAIIESFASTKILSLSDIRSYIWKHNASRCDDNSRTLLGQIKWKQSVVRVLSDYPCFERVEDLTQRHHNPKYRLLDMEDLRKVEARYVNSSNKTKARDKAFPRAMNLIKAFRK